MDISNIKGQRLGMPFGYSKDDLKSLTYKEARLNLNNLIPLDKLSEDQKITLAIDSWEYGYWHDMNFEDQTISLSRAIKEAKQKSEIGQDLVGLTLLGFEHLYEVLTSIQNTKNKLTEVNKVSILDLETSDTLASFTTYNQTENQVSVYKKNSNGAFEFFGDIPANSHPETTTPDFLGQEWNARLYDGDSYTLVGAYMAYPGCASWDIVSFEADDFAPSAWLSEAGTLQMNNNLKTYVAYCQVLGNGKLSYFAILPPGGSCTARHVYKGSSFIALQGDTVLDEFVVEDSLDTTWSLDPSTPPAGIEAYLTGDNDYIFYQVNNPQDDTVTPTTKTYSKTIPVASGTTYLYASIYDSGDAFFAIPQGVTVTIQSTSDSGVVKHYNTATSTDDLYIEMTPDGTSVLKLCVKNPVEGQWQIIISGMTNTPFCFQFQTLPTNSPYTTMQTVLSPSNALGSGWEDIAYTSLGNIVNTVSFVGAQVDEDVEFPFVPIILALVVALAAVNVVEGQAMINAANNNRGAINECTDTVRDLCVPVPNNLKNVLLVDANGADKGTISQYKARKKYLYPNVTGATFRSNNSSLIGNGNATKSKLATSLALTDLGFVSAAGHGNINMICGYTKSGTSPFTPILTTDDVNATPALAQNKIFHILGCNTAKGLGKALINNGAVAYIGYQTTFVASSINLRMYLGDIEIDKALLDGKTVAEAKVIGYGAFSRQMDDERYSPIQVGEMKDNRDNLIVYGNSSAKIIP